MGGIGRIAAAMCGRLFALIASQNKKQREGLALSAVTDLACPAIVSFTSSPESLVRRCKVSIRPARLGLSLPEHRQSLGGRRGMARFITCLTAITVCLLAAPLAIAQAFHPSMVEVGTAEEGQHVTFDPPFPSAPRVVVAVTVVAPTIHVNCSPSADNITASGFDYHSNCGFHLHVKAAWTATFQQ